MSHTPTVPNSVPDVYAVAHIERANSQSIGDQMAKGNAAALKRIRALLIDHSPKSNHKFSPDTLTFDQAGADKSRRIVKAAI